ncbi:PAS domain-containing protein [Coleofasciculus sp. F4-SAH-05]|uniref:PAS domain-containing protein n=1 Tax=Coleofasciculus TaxID=669368 RepID=UPI0032F102C2
MRLEGLIYTVAHDITARKQTEEKLHLLERAIAAASNGIVITDAQAPDHPIVYVNPSFERILVKV